VLLVPPHFMGTWTIVSIFFLVTRQAHVQPASSRRELRLDGLFEEGFEKIMFLF